MVETEGAGEVHAVSKTIENRLEMAPVFLKFVSIDRVKLKLVITVVRSDDGTVLGKSGDVRQLRLEAQLGKEATRNICSGPNRNSEPSRN